MIILRIEYISEAGFSGTKKGMQSHICKIVNDQEITDPNIILNKIRNFYESLFKKGD